MKGLFLFLFLLFGIPTLLSAQNTEPSFIPIQYLDDSISRQRKPVILLIGAKWCSYCVLQSKKLEKEKQMQTIQRMIYFAEMDAETRDTIRFHHKIYLPSPNESSEKLHEFVLSLAEEHQSVSFPLWIFMDEDYHIIYRYTGILTEEQLNKVSLFFFPNIRI